MFVISDSTTCNYCRNPLIFLLLYNPFYKKPNPLCQFRVNPNKQALYQHGSTLLSINTQLLIVHRILCMSKSSRRALLLIIISAQCYGLLIFGLFFILLILEWQTHAPRPNKQTNPPLKQSKTPITRGSKRKNTPQSFTSQVYRRI